MKLADLLLDDWEVRYEEGNKMTVQRDGWMVMANKASGAFRIYDPGGCSVPAPDIYSMEALESARWRCRLCGRTVDQLEEKAFNKTACVKCLREEKEALL